MEGSHAAGEAGPELYPQELRVRAGLGVDVAASLADVIAEPNESPAQTPTGVSGLAGRQDHETEKQSPNQNQHHESRDKFDEGHFQDSNNYHQRQLLQQGHSHFQNFRSLEENDAFESASDVSGYRVRSASQEIKREAERMKKSHSMSSISRYNVMLTPSLFESDDEEDTKKVDGDEDVEDEDLRVLENPGHVQFLDEPLVARVNSVNMSVASPPSSHHLHGRFSGSTKSSESSQGSPRGLMRDTEAESNVTHEDLDQDQPYAHARTAALQAEDLAMPRVVSVDSIATSSFAGNGVPSSSMSGINSDVDNDVHTPGAASQASSVMDDTSTEGEESSSRRSEDSRPPPLMSAYMNFDSSRFLRGEHARQRSSLGSRYGIQGIPGVKLRLEDEDDSDFDTGYDSTASPRFTTRGQPMPTPHVLGGPEMFDFDVMKRKTRMKTSKKLDKPSVRKGQMWFLRVLLFPIFVSFWSSKLKTQWLIVSICIYVSQMTATFMYWTGPEEPSEATRYEIIATLIIFLIVAFMLGHCAAVSSAVSNALKKEREDSPMGQKDQTKKSSATYTSQSSSRSSAHGSEKDHLSSDEKSIRDRFRKTFSSHLSVGSAKYVTDGDDYDDEEDDSISSDEDENTDFDDSSISQAQSHRHSMGQRLQKQLPELRRPMSQKSVTSARSSLGSGLGRPGALRGHQSSSLRSVRTSPGAIAGARPLGIAGTGQRVRIHLDTDSSDNTSPPSQDDISLNNRQLPSPPNRPQFVPLGDSMRFRGQMLSKTSSVRSLLWSTTGPPQESTLSVTEMRNRIYTRISMSKPNLTYVRFADMSALFLPIIPMIFRVAKSFLPVVCWFAEQPESQSFMSFAGFDELLRSAVCVPVFGNETGEVSLVDTYAEGRGLNVSVDPLVCYLADQERCEHTLVEAIFEALRREYNFHASFIALSSMVTSVFLLAIFFQFVVIAEESFRRRLLYAKYFGMLTSSRRAQKARLPHFRLNRVNHIRVWLDLRNNPREAHNSSYQFGDAAANTLVLATLTVVARACLRLFSGAWSFERLDDWATLLYSSALIFFMYRFMNLASSTQKKYSASARILYTEQLNIYIRLFSNPENKDELVACNNMLKIAIKLLSSEAKPGKDAYKAILLNPIVYNLFRVTILSALGTMSSDFLGFKVRLWKI
mmetsp:Transcript_16663/g.32320  ORF Transcript_16663/g.32320 Transcript_16663/m.32320 type:complete len:1161 (+) Transcript_16663:176-3658(+)